MPRAKSHAQHSQLVHTTGGEDMFYVWWWRKWIEKACSSTTVVKGKDGLSEW